MSSFPPPFWALFEGAFSLAGCATKLKGEYIVGIGEF